MDTMRSSLSAFADCYLTSVDLMKMFMVDKDMNEITRIWEIFPHVIIHICRYHAGEIIKRNSASEPHKVQIRNIFRRMQYCEFEKEYDKLYEELIKIVSPTLKAYFDQWWHGSAVVWKGFQRLDIATCGVTTTNCNESLHGKLKPLLNKKLTLVNCFRAIRLMHSNHDHRADYREFQNRVKVRYVTNNKDAVIKEITETCTLYVAALIRQQYLWSLKMDALPNTLSVDVCKCSCTFYRTYKFPCVHMFFSRRLNGTDLYFDV